MKIHEHSQMIKHITKRTNQSPEERDRIVKKQRLENQQRMLKKRKEFGINTDALEKQVATLQKELSEDTITTKQGGKKDVFDKVGESLVDGIIKYDGVDPKEQIVKYDSATGLFSNNKKDIAFKDVATARKHNEVYEKYIPEIQEKKKAVTPRVTPRVKPPVKPTQKPFLKPTVTAPITEFDLNYKPYQREESEEFKIAEANFNKMLEESKKQKELEATQGLPGLIPGAVELLKETERSERRMKQNKPITYGGDDNDM